LLSEAEFEYAARAGTTTRYAWGNDIGENNANCSGCKNQWGDKQTAPVGSFQSNAFGLYDMHGNVWQWTEDPWHANYQDAPPDGTVWVKDGATNLRVVRGGAWYGDPRLLRSASRIWCSSILRAFDLGFRVARTL
jgi:formylglycine-generating enzyme required for sulfatase activity